MKAPSCFRLYVFLLFFFFSLSSSISYSQENFRVLPYLQVYETGKIQLTWFSDSPQASQIIIHNSSGLELVKKEVIGEDVPEIYYTTQEKNQNIAGLPQGSWIDGDKSYRYRIQADLPAGISINYTVTLGGQTFNSSFKTPVSKSNWDQIRFVALSDSETEPRGRVTNRAWYPGIPFFRPATTQLWKDKFGTTTEQGFELPNYMLSEKNGYAENLKIINSRNPDFMLMPGDLVQGGAYQPGWDEFFRHNAGEYDKGLSKYPIIPALGNWEAYGAISGGYGTNEKGEFLPLVGRSRFHAYFQTPTSDPLQKHRQSYYRVDYGPVTILTLDSSNGTPDQQASDFDGTTKLTGNQFIVPGTDTQENYTQTQYAGYGGTDLSGFGPGTDQYLWLEENLKTASATGQLIFVQYHHIAYSSGEHGVPMNHELSIGQVGTPMRILHSLLEQYGVIAVFSGHDELFERSFVDEDGDGKGIHYYDVGVAGDGMRGEKRDWQKTPLQTLNYNQYRKWTADQSSVENWNTSGADPVLIDGGKHYGHLEVNLEKIKEGDQEFAKIRFTPVYSFPVFDSNYNLQKVERRVYADEVELKVLLKQLAFVPEVKDSVALFLNEEGKTVLTPKDFLEVLPADPFTYTSSVGFDFSCLNSGVNDVIITSKNTQTAQEWTESTKVWVLDTIPPDFEATNANLAFDKTIGKVIIDATSFYIRQENIVENCMIPFGVSISISVREITCADLDPDGSYFDKPVTITMTDRSGNSTSKIRKINLNVIESKKVSISTSEIFVGQPVTLTLGNELAYSVKYWKRFYQGQTQLFPDQKGKTFVASLPGTYTAVLDLESACVVSSEEISLEVQEAVYTPEVKDSVSLFLNEEGKAFLTPQDFLVAQPSEPFTYSSSKGFEFSCSNLGMNEVTITSENTRTGESWIGSMKVWVHDQLSPVLVPKNFKADFDVTVGSLALKPADFIAELSDNCGIKEVAINKTTATCEDLGKEIPVAIRAVDASGNVVEAVAILTLNRIESKKISISPAGPVVKFIGQTVELTLGNEFDFTVAGWYKNGVLIPNQKEKKLIVSTAGVYFAKLFAKEGCILESKEVKVEFSDLPFSPVKESIVLSLDGTGKAILKPENAFVTWPPSDPNLDIQLSQSAFTCSDIGEKQITITIKNQTDQIWEEKTLVKVLDNLKPELIPKNFKADFDVTVGSLILKPSDFIAELTDNCGVKEVTINKTIATCADLGKEIPVAIRAFDASGNVVESVAFLTLNRIETKKVTISGDSEFCEGEKGLLTLSSEAPFEVIRWRRDGVEIEGQKGKTLEIEQGGSYHAVIRYAGGCLSETNDFVVEVNPLPKGEIEQKGNVLTAPAGFANYQWFRNGELISGANSRELTVHQMGEFTVELTSEAGCKAKLKPVVMTISGLGTSRIVDAEELRVFPNPASNYLEVEIISDQINTVNSIKIVGMDGKDVTSAVIISKSGSNAFTFDITKLSNATYLIYLEGEDHRAFFGRFIKNE